MKVGYDPEFAAQHPGQLLRYHLLEQFFAEPDRKALDFQGPMTAAHAAWLPELYAVGRLAVAPRSGWGRLAVRAYKHVWPCVRALKCGRGIAVVAALPLTGESSAAALIVVRLIYRRFRPAGSAEARR